MVDLAEINRFLELSGLATPPRYCPCGSEIHNQWDDLCRECFVEDEL